jgi:hypothetical protein
MLPPGGVYVWAFESRLMRIWVTRIASSDTTHSFWSTSHTRRRPLAPDLRALQLDHILDEADEVERAALQRQRLASRRASSSRPSVFAIGPWWPPSCS